MPRIVVYAEGGRRKQRRHLVEKLPNLDGLGQIGIGTQ